MTKEQLTAIIIFDIDGVIRDVGNSYRKAIADTVEDFKSVMLYQLNIELETKRQCLNLQLLN